MGTVIGQTDTRASASSSRLAIEDLFPEVYPDLRAIAAAHLRAERRGHTLQATALVHEVFLRLARQDRAGWNDGLHLLAVATQMVRRVLVDHAKARLRRKRDARRRTALVDQPCTPPAAWSEVIALDQVLGRLEQVDPRLAQLVALRVFGGLTSEQSAAALGISRATAARDWSAARAWLTREMREVISDRR